MEEDFKPSTFKIDMHIQMTLAGADPAFWQGGVKSLGKRWAPSKRVRSVSKAGGNFERLALRMSELKS